MPLGFCSRALQNFHDNETGDRQRKIATGKRESGDRAAVTVLEKDEQCRGEKARHDDEAQSRDRQKNGALNDTRDGALDRSGSLPDQPFEEWFHLRARLSVPINRPMNKAIKTAMSGLRSMVDSRSAVAAMNRFCAAAALSMIRPCASAARPASLSLALAVVLASRSRASPTASRLAALA